jgi:hypothetical protein
MKNKKTGIIIALMILISLAIPMVLANDTQNFLTDMKAHPGNYYILNNRTETEMISIINNFANYFGVDVRNTISPGRNFVVIDIAGASESFPNYTYSQGITRAETFTSLETGKNINYTSISLSIEQGYDYYLASLDDSQRYELVNRLDLNGDMQLNDYEVIFNNLKLVLDRLLIYSTSPIDADYIEVAEGSIVQGRPTCAEFGEKDYSAWFKDEFLYKGRLYEDYCTEMYFAGGEKYNIIQELTCMDDGYVDYGFWTCRKGCSHGRCIWSGIYLVVEYGAGDIDATNFYDSLSVWLDAKV